MPPPPVPPRKLLPDFAKVPQINCLKIIYPTWVCPFFKNMCNICLELIKKCPRSSSPSVMFKPQNDYVPLLTSPIFLQVSPELDAATDSQVEAWDLCWATAGLGSHMDNPE